MSSSKILLILSFTFFLQSLVVFASLEKIEGLEYDVRKIEEPPLGRIINKEYDLYELYFENRSDKTFSIPGYSIDLGVDYSTFSEIKALYKDKSNKKFAIFNIAAGAASIALGGIPKLAANTAASSVRTFNNRNTKLGNSSSFLSGNDTYILYPDDGLSLLLFVSKNLAQTPLAIRFVCRDEESNTNNIVINNYLKLRIINAKDNLDESKTKENVIAAPETNSYK